MATAASKVGKQDEVQRSVSTVPREWGRGLQWRSCSCKQPSCHQLKSLKTWDLEKAFFPETAKGTKTNYPTDRKPTASIKFWQTNKNEPGVVWRTPTSDFNGKEIPATSQIPWQRGGRNKHSDCPGTWYVHADSLLIPTPPTQNYSWPT